MQHKTMHKNEQIATASRFWRKVKVFLLSRDTFIFLFFLGISAIFWLVMSLNKTYETRISIPITYLNTPQDIELTVDLPSHIVVKIKDKGTILLTYAQTRFSPLVVDFSQYNMHGAQDKWSIPTTSTFDKEVKELLNPTTQMLDFYPPVIEIEKRTLSQKKVAIVPRAHLSYARQYYPSDSLQLYPDSTTLYGIKEVLDTIQCVHTHLIEASDLNDTLTTTARIDIPDNCKANPAEINMVAPIEFYTEGKQMVPVKVTGVPKKMRVRTFPSEVEVTYMAGFSQFKSIIPADFTVTIQYNDLISSNQTTERLQLEQYPPFVIKPKLNPDRVKWIIEFVN